MMAKVPQTVPNSIRQGQSLRWFAPNHDARSFVSTAGRKGKAIADGVLGRIWSRFVRLDRQMVRVLTERDGYK